MHKNHFKALNDLNELKSIDATEYQSSDLMKWWLHIKKCKAAQKKWKLSAVIAIITWLITCSMWTDTNKKKNIGQKLSYIFHAGVNRVSSLKIRM